MKELKDKFYKNCLFLVQNFKDASERDIEQQVNDVANMPIFKDIDQKTVLETIKRIEHVEGVTMSSATCLSDDKNIKDWLTNERKAECRKNNSIKYSEDYSVYLAQSESFPSEVISRIDETTDTIISKCGDPNDRSGWQRRGMVVGSVQSGKTANYVSLINKAADYGYKIIIVIAGIHENLRKQTQVRINAGFIGIDRDTKTWEGKKVGVGHFDRTSFPRASTCATYDFDIKAARRSALTIDSKCERPLIFIIKKNPRVLDNLIKWIESAPAKNLSNKIEHPFLLIDDEADNASINTAYGKGQVTKINSQIRKILDQFSNASYVGYTATPFANIFIDPESDEFSYLQKEKKDNQIETKVEKISQKDLFPRHFIVGLLPPDNYFGPARIFGDFDNSIEGTIQEIFDNENYITLDPKIHTKYYEPDIPPSLEEAIICFFISDAIKNLRGIFEDKDSSMMINISRFTDVQNKLKYKVKGLVKSIKNKIETYAGLKPSIQEKELKEIKNIFYKNYPDSEFNWSDIISSLIKTYDRIKVKEINQKSVDILKYKNEKNPAKSYIVIGGFSLSRGLTLNGLTISYILRNSLMYDTLLQMGRWFGYRNNYEDICKIWMTENMKDDYEHITDSFLELMEEIRQLEKAEGKTPLDFGLKVLSHPDSLMITAKNKIGKSKIIKTKLDFSGRRIETFSVPINKQRLQNNYDAALKIINHCFSENNFSSNDQYKYNGYFFENIDHKIVTTFLNNFVATSYSSQLKVIDPILKYISRRDDSELKNWDIYVPSTKQEFDNSIKKFPLKRRKFKLNNIEFTAGHRQLKEGEDSSYTLTVKGQVASKMIGKVGLSEEKIKELEKQDGKTAISNPKLLNCYGRKPLLVIHLYDLIKQVKNEKNEIILREHFYKNIPENISVVAWSIIFPKSKLEEEEAEYRVNDIYTRQFSIDEIQLAESEMNDDADLFD